MKFSLMRSSLVVHRIRQSKPGRQIAFLLAGIYFWTSTFVIAAPMEVKDYLLGPQDKLQIKVYDLRPGSVDIHQWDAFDGEFVVDALGRLSLPLIGTVVAKDSTVGQLAETVASKIQQKAGLLQAPTATVQIIHYRPFYVTGLVDSSGEYEFRPGLNVLQALSIAGGPRRTKDEDFSSNRKEVVLQNAEFRASTSEQMQAVVRQARLSAEINNLSSLNIPEYILNYKNNTLIQRAIQDERDYFDLRLSTERSQVASLEATKKNIADQLGLLSLKDANLSRQVDLVAKDLDQVRQLVAKGLSVSTREISAAQSLASYESSKLDVQLAAMHARQELSKIDRDISELKLRRKNESLREMQDLRAKLASSKEKIRTSKILLDNVTDETGIDEKVSVFDLNYSISRIVNGRMETLKADASSQLFPGDILIVSRARELDGARSEKLTVRDAGDSLQ
ncbi:polysaccharide biosynthesis/export family protein [Methylobacterium mesophilicum]